MQRLSDNLGRRYLTTAPLPALFLLTTTTECTSSASSTEVASPCCWRRDSTVYSARCQALGGRPFAIKIYSKTAVTEAKLKAIRREASMMVYITRKE